MYGVKGGWQRDLNEGRRNGGRGGLQSCKESVAPVLQVRETLGEMGEGAV